MCCCRRHEQGFRICTQASSGSKGRAGLALPSFDELSHRAQQGRASAGCSIGWGCRSRATQIVTSARSSCADAMKFPAVVKTSVGTASRGIWFIRDAGLEGAVHELIGGGAFADEVLVQGRLLRARPKRRSGVFCHGRLHRLSVPIGRSCLASAAARPSSKSVSRPVVRAHVANIGQKLGWHGALSVDYILP